MKHVQAVRIGRFLGPVLILTSLLVVALTLTTVLAQEPEPASGDFLETPGGEILQGDSGIAADDGGQWEVGAHHPVCGNLTDHARIEARGLYDKLKGCGWTGRYIYNETWAWEEDFKRSSRGGKEYSYLDTVDLQFYVGHGSPNGYFTFCKTNHDDCCLTTNDCYRSWGDDDNDWVALTSCQVLSDSQLSNWARCMRGTHLILGFKTNAQAGDSTWKTQGYQFARYLCLGYTVPQAWYKAADRTQSAGRVVRTLINELDCLNDKPKTGRVCSDSWDWDAWVQTHRAGSEPPRQVDVGALAGTMPVFLTPPLSLAEAESRYTHLGTVFEISPSRQIQQSQDPIWISISEDRELEMDSSAGLYAYMDLGNLWTFNQAQAALMSPGAVITAGQAISIANAFLRGNNLMLSDAQFYEVISDTISGGDIVSGTTQAMNASLLANENAELWQVIYSRIVTYTPASLAGVAQDPIEFSVVGPGAKQKVYVSTGNAAVRTGLSGAALPVVGMIGGWRQVEEPPRSQAGIAQTIDILPPAQIYTLHDQLAELVSLNPPPIEADGSTILSHTLAYWEEGLGTGQSELYPVYALTVSYTLGTTDLVVDYAYIPANPLYMRPLARIESAPTEMVRVGQTIALTATEASTTLAELGYDASLDFALGSGTPTDYLYAWYIDSVDDANLIGTGRSISYAVTHQLTDRTGSPQQTIILKVTDIFNPDHPSTTATAMLDVYPRVYLPLTFRNP